MKKSKRTLTPKLRFPEFRDKGEWTSEKLGRICKFVRGPFGGALKKEIFVPVGYAVYEQSHAIHKDLDTFRYYIDEIKYNELKRFAVKPNDIIMSCSGTMGKFAVLSSKPTPGVINQALLKLSIDKKYDLGFIAIALELPGNQSRLLAQSAGGAIKNVVGVKLLKEIEISVPAKQEQSRIADCLTALDTLIAAEGRKLEVLRDHKRGLMQQLFPQPGQTQPRLRFPEFRDKPGWKEKALKGFFPRIRNGFVGTATPYYTDDGVPYLQGKNIKSGRIDRRDIVTISKDFHERQKKSQIQINDILMVQSGHVGECAVVDEAHDGANCHALIILSSETNICPDFFLQLFYSEYGKKKIAEITTGNTVKHILASGIKAMKLCVPGMKERERIADSFSSLDTQIAAQAKKIDALKTHKRGLMQQLFPAPEEIEE
jgi:type I restriction enzyme S subunit